MDSLQLIIRTQHQLMSASQSHGIPGQWCCPDYDLAQVWYPLPPLRHIWVNRSLLELWVNPLILMMWNSGCHQCEELLQFIVHHMLYQTLNQGAPKQYQTNRREQYVGFSHRFFFILQTTIAKLHEYIDLMAVTIYNITLIVEVMLPDESGERRLLNTSSSICESWLEKEPSTSKTMITTWRDTMVAINNNDDFYIK